MVEKKSDFIKRITHKVFNKLGNNTESFLLSNSQKIKYLPVFIIGPARSGTTLVYQCIVKKFKVSYIPNSLLNLRFIPSLGVRFFLSDNSCNPDFDFKSNYGKIKGSNSPNQGNLIWGSWFKGRGADLDFKESDMKDIRRFVSMFDKKFCMPFVNKWPGFSVYLDTLHEVFPEALFVRVRRDPLQTAQSVLKGRKDLKGDESLSISRLPSCYNNFIKSNYIEQVSAYVAGVELDIDSSEKKIGEDRFFHIKYDDLCKNPDKIMIELQQWYYRHSKYKLPLRDVIPKNFKVSNNRKVEIDAFEKLKKSLSEITEKINNWKKHRQISK